MVFESHKDENEVVMHVLTVRAYLVLYVQFNLFVTNEVGSVCHWKNQ